MPLNRFIFRLMFAVGLVLTGLTGATYSVVRALGEPGVHAIHAFLIPPDCPLPCWMGIHVGVTTTDEAVQLLRESLWVNQIYDMNLEAPGGFPGLTWDWTAKTPDFINSDLAGALTFNQDRVVEMKVKLNLRFGEVQNALGPPDQMQILSAPLNWPSVFELNQYANDTLEFETAYLCPITPAHRFDAHVTFEISVIPSKRQSADLETICQ